MYFADLHIHSRYSRATSKEGDLPHLDLWARKKGIALVGTGDFTHPLPSKSSLPQESQCARHVPKRSPSFLLSV